MRENVEISLWTFRYIQYGPIKIENPLGYANYLFMHIDLCNPYLAGAEKIILTLRKYISINILIGDPIFLHHPTAMESGFSLIYNTLLYVNQNSVKFVLKKGRFFVDTLY